MATNPSRLSGAALVDRLAIGLSGLCLLHCILSVVLVAAMASAGAFLLHPLFHEIGLSFAILLGAFAFWQGVAQHGRLRPAMIGAAGLGSMALALAVGHGGVSEILFTVLGVTLVAIGHFLNRQAHQHAH